LKIYDDDADDVKWLWRSVCFFNHSK